MRRVGAASGPHAAVGCRGAAKTVDIEGRDRCIHISHTTLVSNACSIVLIILPTHFSLGNECTGLLLRFLHRPPSDKTIHFVVLLRPSAPLQHLDKTTHEGMQHVHPSRLAQVSVNPLLPLSSSSSSSSASSSLSSSTAVAPSPNTLSTAGLAEQRRVAVASKTQFAEGWEPLDVPFKGRGGRRPPPPRDQGWATRTESAASARAQAPSGIAAEAFKVTIEDNSDAVSFKYGRTPSV